ncbi:MAG: thioesterase family protein [Verrucomicrobiota bacterium]
MREAGEWGSLGAGRGGVGGVWLGAMGILEEIESGHSVFETEMAVRPDDIDMNRHVHNSRYLDYVLAARFDQMKRCYGVAMEDFLERGFSWFVKTAHVEHKRPLHLGDGIVVRTRMRTIGRREVTVDFEIVNRETERVSAEGWFAYLFVDAETGKPRTIPDDIREAYSV